MLGERKSSNDEPLCRFEDWQDFLDLNDIGRKAGVPKEKLAQVAVKELVDNALDTGARCDFGLLDGHGFFVEDDGPGIPQEIAVEDLFSVRRGRASSKIKRMPTRGALGNGLRVVTGIVGASGGTLTVMTRGWCYELTPQHDGMTRIDSKTPWEGVGTRIEVRPGPSLDLDDPFEWAHMAQRLAGIGTQYKGKTSPWWYDSGGFQAFALASKDRFVRDWISQFDGCSGQKAGRIAGDFKNRTTHSLEPADFERLLYDARGNADQVKPKRLGRIGPVPDLGHHARDAGTFMIQPGRGSQAAKIPFVVEVWATACDSPSVTVCVNRTPITDQVYLYRGSRDQKNHYIFRGCNLNHLFKVGTKHFSITVNITTPRLAITTDGKAPDLRPMWSRMQNALEKAVGAAKRRAGEGCGSTKDLKESIRGNLEQGIQNASKGGKHTYSQRSLFYAIRPLVLAELNSEPSYGWFCQVLTELEAEGGDIPGMYRDVRGMLYIPHLNLEIPLGTRAVRQHTHQKFVVNKVLYIEKTGLISVLRDEKWPERHDCAVMTAQGFTTRAARDVIDLIADSEEGVSFFCAHDCDAFGTMIYQSLQMATKARAARRVEVHDLGLHRDDALAMGLEPEVFEPSKRRRPVSDDCSPELCDWYQTRRIELDSMMSQGFINWLDRAIVAASGSEVADKVIPHEAVMQEQLLNDLGQQVRQIEVEKALHEAKVDEKVQARMKRLGPVARRKKLRTQVRRELRDRPEMPWVAAVRNAAVQLASTPRPG